MRAAVWIVVVLLAAAVGFLAGQRQDATPSPGTGEADDDGVLYWVAPMDPDYRRDEPGKSPMGMDLVPVYASDASTAGSVSVAPEVRQSLGVRTAPVVRATLARQLDALGHTRWDESTVTMMHARAEGWLQTFNVASVGDRVAEGQTLYELFSPKLVSAQQEFLSALASGNASLTRASRDRLRALGLAPRQIGELERRRKVVEALPRRADRVGTVIAMDVRKGNYVMPSTHVLTLAGLQTIWVEVDVHERDIGWMRPGLSAVATFEAYPGEEWRGEIGFVYPELDADTRTLRVRLTFDNADERLRPNMLARVRLDAPSRADVLQIPAEAALRGSAGARVLVEEGEGRFRVQPVRLGVRSGAQVEVLEGLRAGQRVVTSGQFLLDAEANGAQAAARLGGAERAERGKQHQGTGAHMHGHGDAVQVDGGDGPSQRHDHAMHHAASPADEQDQAHAEHLHGMAPTEKERAHHDGMHSHGHGDSAAQGGGAPTGIRTKARIVAVVGAHELRVRHDEIPELGWPVMTMNFEVDRTVELEDRASGDRVTLTLESSADGRYRIVAIDDVEASAAMDAP